jgi:LCP family protein required for cell wall assembly
VASIVPPRDDARAARPTAPDPDDRSITLPQVERRSARPAGFRLLRNVVLVLVVILVVAPFLGALALQREAIDELAAGSPFVSPMHVLITGSDSRADLSPEDRIALTTGSAGGERADTIMLLTIDGGRAGLLSFPRDLSVERCDGSVGRINGAIAIGGPGCLVDTVRRLSGIPVHHHVAVTFGGFRDVVDAVGGVELCLDRPIRDRSAGIDLPEGCQVLDGRDALGYVRVRKIDSDFGRIGRQQEFLRALAREMTDPTLLVRPWRLIPIVVGTSRAVTVDDGMGPVELARLALALRALASGDVFTAAVPADGFTSASGASLLRMRAAEAEALFAGFRGGSLVRAGRSD